MILTLETFGNLEFAGEDKNRSAKNQRTANCLIREAIISILTRNVQEQDDIVVVLPAKFEKKSKFWL